MDGFIVRVASAFIVRRSTRSFTGSYDAEMGMRTMRTLKYRTFTFLLFLIPSLFSSPQKLKNGNSSSAASAVT